MKINANHGSDSDAAKNATQVTPRPVMLMNENELKKLWNDLVISDLIGTMQRRELVFSDSPARSLKVYIYCETNHKRPHIHVYWKNEFKISIAIANGEVLAGEIPNKNLKAIKIWIGSNMHSLLETWEEIQAGRKPELAWAKNKDVKEDVKWSGLNS